MAPDTAPEHRERISFTMSTHEGTAPKADIYTRVTDAIIEAIENGAGTYRMPWVVRQNKGFSPISIATVKPYRGINTVVLWSQAQTKGYGSALWGTYQQWQSLGGQVRKGEHGAPVVYWGSYEAKETADEQDSRDSRHLFCKGYTVFNLDQVDGVKLPKRLEPQLSRNERIARAESFFAAVGVEVRDGGNRAFYRPDVPAAVWMPGFDQFPEASQYYSVLAHEATHWTSHESRCDRQLGKRFGDEAYAMEELSPNWAVHTRWPRSSWNSRRGPIMRRISTRGCACSRPISGPSSRPRHKRKRPRTTSLSSLRGSRRWRHDRAVFDLHAGGQSAGRAAF